MPQLPGGRHVGIELAPLNKLIKDIVSGKSRVIWPLMAIEEPNDLWRHIAIVYFERIRSDKVVNLNQNSLPIDAELKPVYTKLLVSDVFTSECDWSEDDKAAFANFLNSERAKPMIDQAILRVTKVQETLLTKGSPIQQWEINAWKAGCHPLQETE